MNFIILNNVRHFFSPLALVSVLFLLSPRQIITRIYGESIMQHALHE